MYLSEGIETSARRRRKEGKGNEMKGIKRQDKIR
jgi:hypothetical protein